MDHEEQIAAKFNTSISPIRYHQALKTAKGFVCFAGEDSATEKKQLTELAAKATAEGIAYEVVNCSFLVSALAECQHENSLRGLNLWMEYHGFNALFEADKQQDFEQQKWINDWYPAMLALYDRDPLVAAVQYYGDLLRAEKVY